MFSKILIALDDSSCSERAAQFGFELARRLKAKVLITHVLETPTYTLRRVTTAETQRERAETLLGPWIERTRQMGLEVQAEYPQRDAAGEAIVELAQSQGCDLIVMGTHGREGLQRMFLGSVAERVSRLSSIPVLLVRADGVEAHGSFQRILAPIDGSEVGKPAFALADALATQLQAQLQILYVTPPIPMPVADVYGGGAIMTYDWGAFEQQSKEEGQAILNAARAQAKAPRISTEMLEAGYRHESEVILEHAKDQHCDLIVMGTHGRSGLERLLLGSVAEGVIHHAHIPVLLVRASQTTEVPIPEATKAATG